MHTGAGLGDVGAVGPIARITQRGGSTLAHQAGGMLATAEDYACGLDRLSPSERRNAAETAPPRSAR